MSVVGRRDSRERTTRRLRGGRIGDKVIARRQAHQLLFHQINRSLAARQILRGMLLLLGVVDLVAQPESSVQPYKKCEWDVPDRWQCKMVLSHRALLSHV